MICNLGVVGSNPTRGSLRECSPAATRADCKSAVIRLRWFESTHSHNISGSSSVGRALAFQAKGRGFESRFPLNENQALTDVSAFFLPFSENNPIFMYIFVCEQVREIYVK